MRKAVEILEKLEDLKFKDHDLNPVQSKILTYALDWKGSADELTKSLTDMYDVTVDKKEISQTIQDLPFNIKEILDASDILAWVLKIPNKIHKKNKKAVERLESGSYGADKFLGSL